MKYFGNAFSKIVVLLISVFLVLGCDKKKEDDATATPDIGSGGLTAAELAGTRYANCVIVGGSEFGTDVDGMSYLRSHTFNADGTYSVSTALYSGTVCQLGGSPIFNYTQQGTFVTGGVMTTPAEATEVVYTVTASILTTYAGEGGVSATWAGYFNSNCPGTTFSTSANETKAVAGIFCSHGSSPAFTFPTFTSIGATLYDSVTLDASSSVTSITTGPTVILWDAGQAGSYPTTSSQTYSE